MQLYTGPLAEIEHAPYDSILYYCTIGVAGFRKTLGRNTLQLMKRSGCSCSLSFGNIAIT